jgi:hypothetical protein
MFGTRSSLEELRGYERQFHFVHLFGRAQWSVRPASSMRAGNWAPVRAQFTPYGLQCSIRFRRARRRGAGLTPPCFIERATDLLVIVDNTDENAILLISQLLNLSSRNIVPF